MLTNRKQQLKERKRQRKERKETRNLLKTQVKDKTALTQHLDVEEGYRQRLLKQSVEVPKWREGTNTILFFSSLEEIYSPNKIPPRLWGSYMQHQLTGHAADVYLARIKPSEDVLKDFSLYKTVMLEGLGETPEAAEKEWWSMKLRSGESLDRFSIRVQMMTQRMISRCNKPEDYDYFLCLSRFLTWGFLKMYW